MLLTQFILQNAHFGLNIFAALIFFAVFWLYFDAWSQTKHKKDLFKILGFVFLSLSFLIHATYIEQSVITSLIFNGLVIESAGNLFKLLGFILIIIGLILDPIQDKPGETGKAETAPASSSAGNFVLLNKLPVLLLAFAFPILSLGIFVLYLRRSTIGLERHLKPLTMGFLFITLYEAFSLAKLLEDTNNINIFGLVRPFGPVWLLAHAMLFIGIVIVAKWVFGYLLKRIQTQLFMIMNSAIIIIFLITTVSFTGLLLNNLQQDALSHLSTDVNVVQYAVGVKQGETLSDAQVVSENTALQAAILNKDKATLKTLSTSILLAKKESFLIITASNGAVLMRGEDNEKIGDSLSSDPLYKKAARGESASSVVTIDGAIAPVVSIRSAVPVVRNAQIIGVVIVGTNIDNAFVDGLKNSTKLSVSVYAGNVLSATTFVAADGKSRYIGVREEDTNIKKTVLIEGKNYSSSINILNVPYFAAFAPLKDVNGNLVGMLFVGKEQISVIQAASSSIEYTFIIAVFFLLISVIPSFMVSRYITKQFN